MTETVNDPSSGDQRGQAVTMSDFGATPAGRRDYIVAEIKAAEKETQDWRVRGNRVVKRYRDDRRNTALGSYERKYNILWSNVQTILPSIFGKAPEPVVMRRYLDPDNVARVAAMILERCLEFQICSQDSFISSMRLALQDRLLPGVGTVWVRYQKAQKSPTGTVDTDYYSKLMGEAAPVDYVYWEDFGWVSARTWDEVPMVWRVVYMTRDQLTERFPKIGKEVQLDYIPARHATSGNETDQPKNVVFKQAKVYEVWDKRTAKVTWISLQHPVPLDEKDDPMRFPGFFPCPKPMFATNTTGNLIPVPDYCLYQDQAGELDNITQRLYHLTKALKVVGVYDSEQTGVQRMLTEGIENQLIPVDTWAAFAEKGGIKGTVDFLPIDKVVEVVTQLYQIRSSLIADIYQITGISDIMRGGAQDAGATATEQRIKAQFASVRLGDMKDQMARFVTDTLRLMAHVMLEFFTDETLVQQSCILQTPDGQKAVKDAQAAMTARMMPPTASPPQPMPAPPGLPSPVPGGNGMAAPPAGPPAMPAPPAGGPPQ